jgi:hypothetical protein
MKKSLHNQLTNLLTNYHYEVESFLKSRQSLSHLRISQYFMELEGLFPYSQEPATGPYPEPDQSSP